MNDRRPSRRRVILTVLVVGFFVGGWLDRQAQTPVELPAVDRILIISDAGPVTIGRADQLELVRRESWLLRPPRWELARDDDEVVVRSRCGRFWPCRSTLEVGVPDGSEVVVVASAGSVHVEGVDASVTIHALADHGVVTLGSLKGSVRVIAQHVGVIGHALQVDDLDVFASGDEIDLRFADAPNRLRAEAGDHPVFLVVPESRYELLVTGGGELATDVESVPGASHVLSLVSSHSVLVETSR